jgi:hypothetical protein
MIEAGCEHLSRQISQSLFSGKNSVKRISVT